MCKQVLGRPGSAERQALTDDEGVTEAHGHVVWGQLAFGQEGQVCGRLRADLQGQAGKRGKFLGVRVQRYGRCHAYGQLRPDQQYQAEK